MNDLLVSLLKEKDATIKELERRIQRLEGYAEGLTRRLESAKRALGA